MQSPAPTDQIGFLLNVQRLLAEGLFTATYKYALLAALADLSVESGDDSGAPLTLSTFAIAEKFVEYYWRHAAPYTTTNDARVLRQNSGSQAKIVSLVLDARNRHGDLLAHFMRDGAAWTRLVRRVEGVVKESCRRLVKRSSIFCTEPELRRTESNYGQAWRIAFVDSIR
jgi:hypothetical protein